MKINIVIVCSYEANKFCPSPENFTEKTPKFPSQSGLYEDNSRPGEEYHWGMLAWGPWE